MVEVVPLFGSPGPQFRHPIWYSLVLPGWLLWMLRSLQYSKGQVVLAPLIYLSINFGSWKQCNILSPFSHTNDDTLMWKFPDALAVANVAREELLLHGVIHECEAPIVRRLVPEKRDEGFSTILWNWRKRRLRVAHTTSTICICSPRRPGSSCSRWQSKSYPRKRPSWNWIPSNQLKLGGSRREGLLPWRRFYTIKSTHIWCNQDLKRNYVNVIITSAEIAILSYQSHKLPLPSLDHCDKCGLWQYSCTSNDHLIACMWSICCSLICSMIDNSPRCWLVRGIPKRCHCLGNSFGTPQSNLERSIVAKVWKVFLAMSICLPRWYTVRLFWEMTTDLQQNTPCYAFYKIIFKKVILPGII